ncbi:DUF3826 domain-containing protein [Pedobacter sp. SYSU D00535]|uniref:DUF3826 domain-containing protein n=1 Tax=Pedobacter sp. SYSU D00535 TaxID=2810308 RepID=UPI001A96D4B9|nr:DUF3826 domain-containing protein [Pedobacter sp. SYSU D00535]
MNLFFKQSVIAIGLSVATVSGIAQEVQTKKEKEAAYLKVVTERAAKIVKPMALGDAEKEERVTNIIAYQYRDLNNIHDSRNEKVKEVKQKLKDDKEEADKKIQKLEAKSNKQLDKLHGKYLARLSKELTPEQVDVVKDGMTYRVLPITYKGYQEMLPNLTAEQKKQILAYLTEAREKAMDAESSEKKHGWFGKYKGKINNYLSAAGIDMNKASKEWQVRIKEESQKKNNK